MKKVLVFMIFSTMMLAKGLGVSIGEETINSFLASAGSFEGTGKINLDFMKLPYNWKISESTIDLVNGGAKFNGNVDIDINGAVTSGRLNGDAKITYDKANQELIFSVDTLNLSGLEDLKLGDIYKPTFSIPLKVIEDEVFEVKKGDEVIQLRATISDEELIITDTEIKVNGNVDFQRI